jgi:hypothetical protein
MLGHMRAAGIFLHEFATWCGDAWSGFRFDMPLRFLCWIRWVLCMMQY